MPSENVEIVRRMYAGFAAGDLEAARLHFHPDVEIDAGTRVDSRPGRGVDFLLETIGSWIEAFDGWREEIEEMRDVDGSVYVAATQHGRSKDTGIELSQRYGLIYDIDDGLIVRMRMFARPEDAAEAIGLSS